RPRPGSTPAAAPGSAPARPRRQPSGSVLLVVRRRRSPAAHPYPEPGPGNQAGGSRSRRASSTSRSWSSGRATSGVTRPCARRGKSGPCLALQARVLDIKVVVQPAGHLGGDPALLAEAAQLLPLGAEQ